MSVASVQELIAAAQASQPRSALAELLQNYNAGYDRGQMEHQRRLDASIKLLQIDQIKQDMARQQQMENEIRQQFATEKEQVITAGHSAIGSPSRPANPSGRFVQEVEQDEKGRYSRKFKVVEPKEIDPVDRDYKIARTKFYEGQTQDIPERQEERQYKQRERRNTERTNIVTRFNADPSTKKSQQMIDGANIIQELATSGNPIAAGAIPTFMARASGEVGNLSEADKAPFGGSRAIMERLQAAVTQASSGQLTPDNQQFIMGLSETMRKRANVNIQDLAKKRAKQYSRGSDFLEEKDILSTLVPELDEETGEKDPMGLGL